MISYDALRIMREFVRSGSTSVRGRSALRRSGVGRSNGYRAMQVLAEAGWLERVGTAPAINGKASVAIYRATDLGQMEYARHVRSLMVPNL